MTRISLLLVLFLIGCASTPTERSYYLLRAEAPGDLAPADPDALLGIARPSIAKYLNRAGIVIQVGEHQVREARYHLWAEPLDRGIRHYLSHRVSALLGRSLNTGPGTEDTWRYRIDVSVEEFHGTLNGEVRLVAYWSLRKLKNGTVIEAQYFRRTRQQTGDGYPALVDAQIELLDELAESIVQALRRMSTSVQLRGLSRSAGSARLER